MARKSNKTAHVLNLLSGHDTKKEPEKELETDVKRTRIRYRNKIPNQRMPNNRTRIRNRQKKSHREKYLFSIPPLSRSSIRRKKIRWQNRFRQISFRNFKKNMI